MRAGFLLSTASAFALPFGVAPVDARNEAFALPFGIAPPARRHTHKREGARRAKQAAVRVAWAQFVQQCAHPHLGSYRYSPNAWNAREAWLLLKTMTLADFIAALDRATEIDARKTQAAAAQGFSR